MFVISNGSRNSMGLECALDYGRITFAAGDGFPLTLDLAPRRRDCLWRENWYAGVTLFQSYIIGVPGAHSVILREHTTEPPSLFFYTSGGGGEENKKQNTESYRKTKCIHVPPVNFVTNISSTVGPLWIATGPVHPFKSFPLMRESRRERTY